jgi:hypothetical protein
MCAFAMFLLSAAAGAEPVATIQNSACDQAAEDGKPIGWTYSFSSGGKCDLVVDREMRRSGEGSIRLENDAGGAKYPRMFQALALPANTRFLLSAWVRASGGRAFMQVTPAGGTWFGKRDYGRWVVIAEKDEWRQVQKQFATGDQPVEVNIVFTLDAPQRTPGVLWVDEVSLTLDRADTATSKPAVSGKGAAELIPPVDTGVVLPHVDWAPDLPGPRPRVLFVAPAVTIRDVIELAQRLDVEAEFQYASADLIPVLERDWDAVLLASVDWDRLGAQTRDRLWSKVESGMGLMLVNPVAPNDRLDNVLQTLRPFESQVFFSGESDIGLPLLQWVRDTARPRVGTLGSGRVAVIEYDLGEQTEWGSRVCSMFPPYRGRVPRGDEMPWWEPYFALLGRTLLWTGGRDCSGITQVSAVTVEADNITLDVQFGNGVGAGKVRAICVGPGNRRMAEVTIPVVAGEERRSISLPGDFLAGDHLVWLWGLDTQDRTVGWAAWYCRVPGPSMVVTPDRERYERGDPVGALVRIPADTLAGGRIEVRLVDGFGRVVAERSTSATAEASFELDSSDVQTLTARIVATLSRETAGGSRPVCEAYCVIPVAHELDDREYQVGIWASYFQLACSRPWSHHLVRLQREMGVDFGLMAHSAAEMYHQAYAEHNMVPAPENMHRIFFKLAERFETMNLADPEFEPQFRQAIRDRARVGYRWGAGDFSVGDECGYTLRYDEHTLARFRVWLRQRHGDIAALNNQWGTALAKWEDISADTIKTVDPRVSIGPKLEFQLFSDRLFCDFFRIAQEEVHKLDPQGRCGLSGTRDPGHYIGFDWYELMKHVTHLAFYDGIQRECIRSFMKPGDLITSFVGYDFYDLDERNARYFPWLELFNGFQGISIYSASSGAWHGYIRHDLSWTERAKWTMDELGELKTGVARALLTATRASAPIAVMYSQRSLHAAGNRRWRENFTGVCEVIKDLGLQFDVVADEQVGQGVLAERAYKLLFLPLSVALAEEEMRAVEIFATRGGRVVVAGEAGVFNRHGRTREHGVLDALLGVATPTVAPPPVLPPESVRARLFGVEIEVTPCAVSVPDGFGQFDGLETAVGVRRQVGQGEVVFLNFLWNTYRSFRSGGVGGEITQRISAGADQAEAFWKVMEALLGGLQIEPPAAISCNGEPLRTVEQVVYRRGPITYLGLLPRYFGGRYAPASQQVRSGGKAERVSIRPEDFALATITPTIEGYWYDVRARKSLGRAEAIEAKVTDGVALLYAVAPYEVSGLALTVPEAVRAGDTVEVLLTVGASSGQPGDHVVHVTLTGPDGKVCRWSATNLLTREGRSVWRPRLALNAEPGTWRIDAQELISGRTAVAEFTVATE